MKDEVLALIRELAAMLEPGANAAWEIVLRQQTIKGTLGVGGSGILLLIIIACLIGGFVRQWRDEEPYGYFVAAFFVAIFAVPWFVTSLQQLMNPAYYAMMTLREML